MWKHHAPNLLSLCLVLIAGCFFLFRPTPHVLEKTSFQLPDGSQVIAEIARTEEEQRKGLGGRRGLNEGEGMYFPFVEPSVRTFWMKDMTFAVDIVWLREGTVVGVEAQVPPPKDPKEPLRTYPSVVPIDAVLELSAGDAEAHGLLPGTQLLPLDE